MSARKRIFLHVGNLKTGSSAIQQYCHANYRDLIRLGHDYLQVSRPRSNPTNHGLIPLSLLQKYNGYLPNWYRQNIPFDDVQSITRKAIAHSSCVDIIISSEEFYRLAGYKHETQLKFSQDLQNLFRGYDVFVIMYLRDPLSFCRSWYSEINRAGQPVHRFLDFFTRLNSSYLLPQRNARFWRDNFGKERLMVLPYREKGSQHIRRFLRACSVEDASLHIDEDFEVNRSLDLCWLEGERLRNIARLDSAEDRREYMISHALSDLTSIQKTKAKIDKVNRLFEEFCAQESVEIEYEKLSFDKLLVYEELVNRKDALMLPATPMLRARLSTDWIKALAKWARDHLYRG